MIYNICMKNNPWFLCMLVLMLLTVSGQAYSKTKDKTLGLTTVVIDPGHGGPIHYETLERVTIEKIETVEKYGKISKEITVNIDGESVVCQLELMNVVRVKNGELQALSENDIMEGDCLIVRQGYWNGLEGKEEYRIFGIFYLENN